MKIQHDFTVERNISQVWEFFQDIPSVADCLPGAELTEDKGDNVYAGSVAVKLGPMTASFEGEATITPEPESHTATIAGKGVDRRGGSRGQVSVVYRLAEAGTGSTKVDIDADVMLSGPAAQFGRTGLVNEISKRLIGDFVACLEAKLAATTKEAAAEVRAGEVSGIALFFTGLWSWLRKLFTRSSH
ncbi:MAG TPA: SRPBCC family protein [Acidimicrobiia bacterium]|nr:SRPBCC family protein [Acidimicrobiia bacterium]